MAGGGDCWEGLWLGRPASAAAARRAVAQTALGVAAKAAVAAVCGSTHERRGGQYVQDRYARRVSGRAAHRLRHVKRRGVPPADESRATRGWLVHERHDKCPRHRGTERLAAFLASQLHSAHHTVHKKNSAKKSEARGASKSPSCGLKVVGRAWLGLVCVVVGACSARILWNCGTAPGRIVVCDWRALPT